jgi:type VII secretion integral membrane protein EccD
MSKLAADELCRLVIEGPTSRIDLSVPNSVPLCDLLPSMLHWLGPELSDVGLDHAGWALQRLGEPPLDEDLSCGELGLHDGERLYLRPRSSLIPPLDFDDLVDGMANGAAKRPGLWTPRHTELAGHLALVFFVAVSSVLALRLPSPVSSLLVQVPLVLALLGGAALTTWRSRAKPASNLLGGLAVAASVVAAVHVAPVVGRYGPWFGVVLAGACGAVLIAATAAVGRIDLLPAIGLHVVLLEALLALGAGLLAAGIAGLAGVALVETAVVLTLRPGVPVAAFRLAGLRMPPLPRSTEDIQRDNDPEPGSQVRAAALRTDAFMTAALAAGGAVLSGSLAVLVALPGPWGVAFAATIAANLLLSARPLTSAWHRLACALPAAVTLAVGCYVRLPHARPLVPVTVALALAVFAVAAPALARAVLRRPVSPRVGRLGDILQTLTLLAAAPLAVFLLDLLALVRRVVM